MDLRAASPAFGTWHAERFGQGRRAALVLPPGVGHTFLSLADGSAVAYLISHSHNPGLERRINPLDPDNVVTGGQTVALSGSGTDLGFLGASQNGTASGTVTVHYTDGSSQSFNLNMADWYANSPAVGNQLLTTTTSWNFTSSTQTAHPVSIYFASVPLQAGKTVASVTLPTVSAGVGNGITALHVFAMAIGSGTPTIGS